MVAICGRRILSQLGKFLSWLHRHPSSDPIVGLFLLLAGLGTVAYLVYNGETRAVALAGPLIMSLWGVAISVPCPECPHDWPVDGSDADGASDGPH